MIPSTVLPGFAAMFRVSMGAGQLLSLLLVVALVSFAAGMLYVGGRRR